MVVLAAELLREAEKLVSQRVHPQTIITGYRKATEIARDALTKAAKDNSKNPEKFKEDLLKVTSSKFWPRVIENDSFSENR